MIRLGVPVLLLMAGTVALPAEAHAQWDIDDAVAACKADPAYRIGGAAIGECLEHAREATDRRTDALVESEAARRCQVDERQALYQAQADWQNYRDAHCALIASAPGNTVSYVNGTVCGLMLSRHRLKGLELMAAYAKPRCPSLRLVEEGSRPGPPPDGPVTIPDGQAEWQVEGGFGAQRLVVRETGGGEPIARLDLGNCFFCTGEEDNCSADGIYLLQEPDDPARPRLFAVCHVGAHSQRLTLIDPVARGSEPVFEVTAPYVLDWSIAGGRLVVRIDGEETPSRRWPGSEQ